MGKRLLRVFYQKELVFSKLVSFDDGACTVYGVVELPDVGYLLDKYGISVNNPYWSGKGLVVNGDLDFTVYVEDIGVNTYYLSKFTPKGVVYLSYDIHETSDASNMGIFRYGDTMKLGSDYVVTQYEVK